MKRRLAASFIDLGILPNALFLCLFIVFPTSVFLLPLAIVAIQSPWLMIGRTVGKDMLGLYVLNRNGAQAAFSVMLLRQVIQVFTLSMLAGVFSLWRGPPALVVIGLSSWLGFFGAVLSLFTVDWCFGGPCPAHTAADQIGDLLFVFGPGITCLTLLLVRHWTFWDFILRTTVVTAPPGDRTGIVDARHASPFWTAHAAIGRRRFRSRRGSDRLDRSHDGEHSATRARCRLRARSVVGELTRFSGQYE